MHKDYPDAYKRLSNGHMYDMSSNIMELLPEIFLDDIPKSDTTYIKIIGRINNKRIIKYIKREYVRCVDNFGYYKLFIAQANGCGEFGEVISEPEIGEPVGKIAAT
jgi:type II restriction enzyme